MTDPGQLVRGVDAHLCAVRLSAQADARIAGALEQARRRATARSRRRWIAAAVGLAVLLALATTWTRGRETRHPLTRVGERIAAAAGVSFPPEDCAREVSGATITLRGHCRTAIERPRMVVETWGGAVLVRQPDALALQSGWATFDVSPTGPDAPARVRVSGGIIEVLGTRFTVLESDDGGHVDLIEGRIRFLEAGGRVLTVEPGRRHAWSAEPSTVATLDVDPVPSRGGEVDAPRASPRPGPPTPSRRHAAPARADDPRAPLPIEQIAALRSAGRYADAIDLIDAIDPRTLDRRSAETLSYEKGTILQDQLEQHSEACAHWRAHLERFPHGRYLDSVGARTDALRCPELQR